MKTVEGIRIMFKKETGIDPDNSQGEPDIEYVWWLEKQFIEQSQQIELSSDKIDIADTIEYIFKNTERIHGKSEALDWIKIASHKLVEYLKHYGFEIKSNNR